MAEQVDEHAATLHAVGCYLFDADMAIAMREINGGHLSSTCAEQKTSKVNRIAYVLMDK